MLFTDTVNANGNNCPYALKMLACLVLEEITTFLRETFQYLPRKKHKLEPGWDKHLTSRRYSSIISSPGHSDKSSESNVGDVPQPSPGKCSWILFLYNIFRRKGIMG
jgi:hypothetical protein